MLREKREKSFDLSVIPLASEEDWRACRERIERLEAQCLPNPWANWEYMHSWWQIVSPGERCWLVEARDPPGAEADSLLAAAFWREDKSRWMHLSFKALRAFDQVFFMRIPPFLVLRGREAEACQAMAAALGPLARESGAHLLTLYRMDRGLAELWAGELRRRGVFVKKECFTPAPQIAVGEDLDGYLKSHVKNRLRGIRKQKKKIRERWGKDPEMELIETHRLSLEEFARCMDRLEDLQDRTWQGEWEEGAESVDREITRRFQRRAFHIWRERGLLELRFLTIGGRDAAFWAALQGGDRLWVILIGYDKEFKPFGPGIMLFAEALADSHGRGTRLFEVGGEVLGWKKDWASREEEVYKLEVPLEGWKGGLWSLAHRIRGDGAADRPALLEKNPAGTG